ncbi:flagellar hook-length control protein FliK [Undibacterium cyanobacteriorum]|uniref:Flagellar hook-length control protein FliK n=1 Tax=Undibacterium cyanobacteriorum TaxID=3073561 RepID=A0ABY9RLY5_9BURK|nr:flagellar hook-length control protein FliK [Undibacterium sp. 20NA77.5]WMW82214.1 flagellar hook-length control protein FliK [Undibacterium sp. 20NA77.5]
MQTSKVPSLPSFTTSTPTVQVPALNDTQGAPKTTFQSFLKKEVNTAPKRIESPPPANNNKTEKRVESRPGNREPNTEKVKSSEPKSDTSPVANEAKIEDEDTQENAAEIAQDSSIIPFELLATLHKLHQQNQVQDESPVNGDSDSQSLDASLPAIADAMPILKENTDPSIDKTSIKNPVDVDGRDEKAVQGKFSAPPADTNSFQQIADAASDALIETKLSSTTDSSAIENGNKDLSTENFSFGQREVRPRLSAENIDTNKVDIRPSPRQPVESSSPSFSHEADDKGLLENNIEGLVTAKGSTIVAGSDTTNINGADRSRAGLMQDLKNVRSTTVSDTNSLKNEATQAVLASGTSSPLSGELLRSGASPKQENFEQQNTLSATNLDLSISNARNVDRDALSRPLNDVLSKDATSENLLTANSSQGTDPTTTSTTVLTQASAQHEDRTSKIDQNEQNSALQTSALEKKASDSVATSVVQNSTSLMSRPPEPKNMEPNRPQKPRNSKDEADLDIRTRSTDTIRTTNDPITSGSIPTNARNLSEQSSENKFSSALISANANAVINNATPPNANGSLGTVGTSEARTITENSREFISYKLGSQEWNRAIGQKVIMMVAGSEQSAELSLNPPELGPLQVVLSLNDNQVNANFISSNMEVREAIEAAAPRLREMMDNAGVSLTGFSVNSQASQSHQQERPEQRSPAPSQRELARENSAEQNRPATTRSAPTPRGSVDTFV